MIRTSEPHAGGRPLLAGMILFALLATLPARGQLKVGVLVPLNGPDAPAGVALTNGVDLALSILLRGESGRLQVLVEDTSGGEAEAIHKALRLLDHDGAGILLGEIWSSRTLAVAGVARAREALLISPVATHPDVASVGPGVYSLAVPVSRQIDRALVHARDSLGVSYPALYYPETESGRGLAEEAERIWSGLGMRRARRVPYAAGQHDFVGEVGQSLAAGADAIVILGSSREALSIISHASQSGFLGPYIGLEALGTEENLHLLQERLCLAAYAEDSYGVILPGTSGAEVFEQIYRQRYGTAADRFARHGFLALAILVQLLDGSGREREGTVRGLERMRDPLVAGDRRVLRPPSRLGEVRLVAVENGETRLVP